MPKLTSLTKSSQHYLHTRPTGVEDNWGNYLLLTGLLSVE